MVAAVQFPTSGVRLVLSALGQDFSAVLVCVSNELRAHPDPEPLWLVATASEFFVIEDPISAEPRLIYRARFDEVDEFRNCPAVGSGILQARMEEVWIDLLRFTNRRKPEFDRVLRRLEELKRAGSIASTIGSGDGAERCSGCGIALGSSGADCPRCIDHGAAISRMFPLLRPYWKAAVVLLAFLIAGIGLDMAWPLLTRFLVDHVLTGTPAEAAKSAPAWMSSEPGRLLTWVVLALAAVHGLRAAVSVVTGRIGGRVGNAMTHDIRSRLVKKLEALGLSYYGKQDTGALVGRIAYDTEAIQGFINQVTSGFLMQFLLVAISLAMMFSLEPSLAFWALVPAPLVVGGALIYWRHVHPRFQRYWDRTSRQAAVLNGILSGIRVVKAFGQEENEFTRFQRISGEVRGTRESLDRTSATFYPVMGLVFQIGGWLVWYVGGRHVLDRQISLGTLMAFFGYLSMFYGPLGVLTNLTTWLTQFSTQMQRIFEVLDAPAGVPEKMETKESEVREGRVIFRNVSFGYSPGSNVLSDLSFDIAPGERIGIVGRSGSGKTSILNALNRFYDVHSGQVLIDEIDVREMSLADLRSRISMVLQEPFLFRGSLRDNVAYGRPEATPEQILEATRAANAHDFVMRHALAYDTSVGERGSELSGGERQRISIARALLCDRPILLLDEATSSLDSESELAIQSALARSDSRRRTSIIIAHRLSTLQHCDRILVLENGRIVESGAHRELLELGGRYSRWVRIQQGRASLDERDSGVMEQPEPQEGVEVRWLSPIRDRFCRGVRGELQLELAGGFTYRGVFPLRCFPVQHVHRYISLRMLEKDGSVREIGIIRDLEEWPIETRRLIEESLSRRYFFHTVRRIHGVKRNLQYLTFNAATDQGSVEFMIRQNPESAQDFGQKGKLLIDVEDNLYLIPDLERLGRSEREIFNRYVFW